MMRKEVIIVLVTFCLTATLFSIIPVGSQGVREYDPWFDVNDDGKIDLRDYYGVGLKYGTEGTPTVKASIEYDSGWINIADKAGQSIPIVHNLNSTDMIVDMTGKATIDGGVHQRFLGGAGYPPGWSRTYGGLYQDPATSAIQTNDGGYAITGFTRSFEAHDPDFWLVKTDASGNMQWNRRYGGTGHEYDPCVVQTSDGGYALAGATNSSGAGDLDFWLVKTDANGNAQWNRTYGGAGKDHGWSVVQTDDDGYAIAGFANSFGIGHDDFWLVKTDSSGNMQWNKTYGDWTGEYAHSLIKTSDGGYAIAGYTYSFGAGCSDFWLVKADASGNMEWNATYGTIDYEYGERVVQTEDGGYAIVGWTLCFDGDHNNSSRLVKTDANGNVQWEKTFGGLVRDCAFSVVQSGDGGYAVAGATLSSGAGSWDFWLVRMSADGTVQWSKTYGGTNLDMAFSLIRIGDGGYVLAGATMSSGAGDQDFWLVKTDANGNMRLGDWFEYGLAWIDSTKDSITLYRGSKDTFWNFVRVRIWRPRNP